MTLFKKFVDQYLGDNSQDIEFTKLSRDAQRFVIMWYFTIPIILERFINTFLSLVMKAFEGIDQSKLVDFHTHIIGSSAPCFVDESYFHSYNPANIIKKDIYMSAFGVTSLSRGNGLRIRHHYSIHFFDIYSIKNKHRRICEKIGAFGEKISKTW